MYILLTDEKIVQEIIPDENPVFPGVSIYDRYSPDFTAKLLHFPDDTVVKQNWTYDSETETFYEVEIIEEMGETDEQYTELTNILTPVTQA